MWQTLGDGFLDLRPKQNQNQLEKLSWSNAVFQAYILNDCANSINGFVVAYV